MFAARFDQLLLRFRLVEVNVPEEGASRRKSLLELQRHGFRVASPYSNRLHLSLVGR
jgi:hypothetical protein